MNNISVYYTKNAHFEEKNIEMRNFCNKAVTIYSVKITRSFERNVFLKKGIER